MDRREIPERYYTPQQPKKVEEQIHAEAYQPTPRPESVYILDENARAPKKESCCISCLLACFLCFAVKGESGSPPEK